MNQYAVEGTTTVRVKTDASVTAFGSGNNDYIPVSEVQTFQVAVETPLYVRQTAALPNLEHV